MPADSLSKTILHLRKTEFKSFVQKNTNKLTFQFLSLSEPTPFAPFHPSFSASCQAVTCHSKKVDLLPMPAWLGLAQSSLLLLALLATHDLYEIELDKFRNHIWCLYFERSNSKRMYPFLSHNYLISVLFVNFAICQCQNLPHQLFHPILCNIHIFCEL